MCEVTIITCRECKILTRVRMSHCMSATRTLARCQTPSEWKVLGKFTWSPVDGCRGLDITPEVEMTRDCQPCRDKENTVAEPSETPEEALSDFFARQWLLLPRQRHSRELRDRSAESTDEDQISGEREGERDALTSARRMALSLSLLAAISR